MRRIWDENGGSNGQRNGKEGIEFPQLKHTVMMKK